MCAEKLSKAPLPQLADTVKHGFETKSLRMVATNAPNPLLSFDTLPSGHFKYLRYRINLLSKSLFYFIFYLFFVFLYYM